MRTFVYESGVWLPLRFSVVTPTPMDIQAGTRIDYRLRFRGCPLRWRSEITEWAPPHRFSDMQVRGPYRRWIHEHSFTERDGGTLAGDRVQYAVWGGALVDKLVIRRDVERIFDYRKQTLTAMFANGEVR